MSDSLRPHGLYVARQTSLSVEFPRQEYWSGLPFLSSGNLPDPAVSLEVKLTDFVFQMMCALKSLQLCLTLCDNIDCGSPGSSVHGILQTRILEWVAMPSFRGSF